MSDKSKEDNILVIYFICHQRKKMDVDKTREY